MYDNPADLALAFQNNYLMAFDNQRTLSKFLFRIL